MSSGVSSSGDLRRAVVVGGLRGLARTTPWMESELVGVSEIIPRGGVCIDIGAAAGFYTAELARLVGDAGVVHSVEPLRFAHATASRLLGLRTGRNVVRHSLALGETGEELVMSVPLRKGVPITGRSFITRNASGLGSNANSKSIYEWSSKVTPSGFTTRLGLQRLDFVKIDVEGAELHVLRGGHATIATLKPAVMVEVEDSHLERFGVGSDEIAAWFTSQDYRMSVWDSGTWREVDAVTVQFRNYLFTPPGWVKRR